MNLPENVIGTVYETKYFTYVKGLKSFVGEISDTPQVLRQLWNDSMDLGFGIRSHKTGRVVFFTLKNIWRDDEGDVIRWVFDVFNPTQHPDLEGLTATIYND